MKQTMIVFIFSLLMSLPSVALAQACSSTDQDNMNSCVGDSIDTCQATYSSCVREVDESDDVYGRFLEKCCCKNGERRNAGQFLACKNTVKNNYKAAKAFRSILNSNFTSGFYPRIKTAAFSECNFGCDF